MRIMCVLLSVCVVRVMCVLLTVQFVRGMYVLLLVRVVVVRIMCTAACMHC